MNTLILDCGGVMVFPRLGDWNLPFGLPQALGDRAGDVHTSKYLLAHHACAEYLSEARLIKDTRQEQTFRLKYLRAMNARMGWRFTDAQLKALARDFTLNEQRYGVFEDVAFWLKRWKERFRLGILSDAMPSILVFMRAFGLLQYFDAVVISTQVGVIKPDPAMYAAILKKLDARGEDCLFIDDRAENLTGAQAAGMHAVQMARPSFLPRSLWQGGIVRDFESLNRYIERTFPQ